VSRCRSSSLGWLASSVLMEAARFLVMRPRGEPGAEGTDRLDREDEPFVTGVDERRARDDIVGVEEKDSKW
jgi:hypothetical protein